jgi:phage FluMu protein Com
VTDILEIRCHKCNRLLGKVVNDQLEIAKGGEVIAKVYGPLIVAICPRCGFSNVVKMPDQKEPKIINGKG